MAEEEKLKIKKEYIDPTTVIYLSGQLDAHTAPDLEDYIREVLDKGSKNLLFNFKDLEYISSAGLGVFMAFIEEVRNNNGDIKFSEMQENVYSVFDLLGFPMLFDIVEKDEKALEKFQSGDIFKNE